MLRPCASSHRLQAGLIGACLFLLVGAVSAKASSRVGYTLPQVYSSALRYLRIDLGYEVTEKDPKAAYLLFRYPAPNQKSRSFGAIELVANSDEVRVVVKLPQMPSYHEAVMRDGLLKKLKEDYGVDESRRRPKESPKKPPGKKDELEPDESSLERAPASEHPPRAPRWDVTLDSQPQEILLAQAGLRG